MGSLALSVGAGRGSSALSRAAVLAVFHRSWLDIRRNLTDERHNFGRCGGDASGSDSDASFAQERG
jgi:hypothetical protein